MGLECFLLDQLTLICKNPSRYSPNGIIIIHRKEIPQTTEQKRLKSPYFHKFLCWFAIIVVSLWPK